MASEKYSYSKECDEYYGRLKKIKRKNNTIQADYYPENGNNFGHIEIDVTGGNVIQHTPINKQDNSVYAYHAKCKLLRIAELKPLPKETVEMWY